MRVVVLDLGFLAASEAAKWGSRWVVEPLASSLSLSAQVGLKPAYVPVGSPHQPRHVDNRVGWFSTCGFVCTCVIFHRPRDDFCRSAARLMVCSACRTRRVFPPQRDQLCAGVVCLSITKQRRDPFAHARLALYMNANGHSARQGHRVVHFAPGRWLVAFGGKRPQNGTKHHETRRSAPAVPCR